MKHYQFVFLLLYATSNLWSQTEVKYSPSGFSSGSNAQLNIEFIKNESRSLEVVWDMHLRVTNNTRYHNLSIVSKRYRNPRSGADGYSFSPFLQAGIGYNRFSDPKLKTISGALGYLVGYKHLFKNGIFIEPTIALALGINYGIPVPGINPSRTIDRYSVLFEPDLRLLVGYRFGRKKLISKEE